MEEPRQPEPSPHAARRPSPVMLIVLAALFVFVPLLFWHQTWFGRTLGEEQVGQYLQDNKHLRKVQHALAQISERIVRGDPAARRWYPQVVALARHPDGTIRATTAWVLGQDNNSGAFHQALLPLLDDPDLMVRRNAALSLVRFGDAGGRSELIAMLEPYTVRAPVSGRISIQLAAEQRIGAGAKLAAIQPVTGPEIELRSPLSGDVGAVLARDGSSVASGDPVISVEPEQDQVWEALRALYFIGLPEDYPLVESFSRDHPGMSARIRQQAVFTAQAIRTRAEREATR